MPLMRRLAALGVAAEAARRFASKNPEKAREITDKAASFVDQRTKGKYSSQIGSVKRQLAEYGGYASPDPIQGSTVVVDAPAATHGFGDPNPASAGPTAPTGTDRPVPPTPYKRG
jgi:hypothetical protein